MVSCDFARDPKVFNMMMKFIRTPRSHYNTITKVHARFLYSLVEGLSIDFPPHYILSILDTFCDTTSCNKLIFPSSITRILIHAHVSFPSTSHFYVMIVIGKESIM